MTNNSKEKRNLTRVKFSMGAELSKGKKKIKGTIENLSMKGILVKCAGTFNVRDLVKVTIRLSGSSTDLSIKIKGDVIRSDDSGTAIHFKEMELDSFIHLRNVVFYADKELQEFYEFM